MEYQVFVNHLLAAYNEAANRWGVDPMLAYSHAFASALLYARTGRGAPPITSGFRSQAKQDELRRRWAAGEPGIYKPARVSKHSSRRAIDVSTRDPNFSLYKDFMKMLGVKWGGDFSRPDPVHFELP